MRSELPWCAGGGASVVAAAVVFIIIVLSGINYEMIEHANKQTAANQLFIFSVFLSLYPSVSLSLTLSITVSHCTRQPRRPSPGAAPNQTRLLLLLLLIPARHLTPVSLDRSIIHYIFTNLCI
jgi:hypothetical protein